MGEDDVVEGLVSFCAARRGDAREAEFEDHDSVDYFRESLDVVEQKQDCRLVSMATRCWNEVVALHSLTSGLALRSFESK